MLTCRDCQKGLPKTNRSGLCRPCSCRQLTANPAINARRLAAHKEAMGRAGVRADNSRRTAAYYRDNPDARSQRAERGRRDFHRTLGTPRAKAAASRPEVIARRAKTYSNNRLAWCPEAWRDEYRRLLYVKQFSAAEARRIVLDAIARETASLTPFERMMQKVRNGSGIREIRPFRKADPEVSMTGCSADF